MNKQHLKTTLLSIMVLVSTLSHAGYDSNLDGVVKQLVTYTSGRVYVRLSTQPSEHPECSASYFSLDQTIPADVRAQILARLLSAKAMQENIRIGYDGTGNCSNGYIRIHRVG